MSITQRNYAASPTAEIFSLNPELLETILDQAKPMGHSEDARQLNLGFGFVYYGLVRALRPKHVLVIGSGYGFSVVCLALGLKDNQSGELTFVDPSYSLLPQRPVEHGGRGQFWHDPQHVREHFAQFGVADIVTHHKMTSEEFFDRYKELQLPKIDLAFIDGNHAYRHVRARRGRGLRHSRKNSYLLLHDTNIYIRETLRHAGVKRWLKRKIGPRKAAFEYVDFPFASGVALVRVLEPKVWRRIVLIAGAASLAAAALFAAAPTFSGGITGSGATRRGSSRRASNYVSPADGTVVYVKRVAPQRAGHRLQAGQGGLDQRHRSRGAALAEDPHRDLHEPVGRALQPRAAGRHAGV